MNVDQPAYLLTWNPKYYSLVKSVEGGDQEQPYAIGDEIRWTCSSKQPRLGDTVYLIRLGEEPRGLVGKGVVTKESFDDADWRDPEKQRQYIQFRFEDIRLDSEDGLIPMMMLERVYPQQKWSPQSSGISIKQEYIADLAELWAASRGLHSSETVLLATPRQDPEKPTDTRTTFNSIKEEEMAETVELTVGSNTIFYGPPGTGKTYHVVEAAVRVAEPEFTDFGNREYLKTTYDLLVKQGRIRFVTFHQSYSYEEFVEGLRANTDGTGQVSYAIESGIFKQICAEAAIGETGAAGQLEQALEQLISELREGDPITLQTKTGKRIQVAIHGTESFRITPEDSVYEHIGKGYSVPFQHILFTYRGLNKEKIYYPSYAKAILTYIQDKYSVPDFQPQQRFEASVPFVLIIDEINRGNISKIFGELITLIEPSKRAGQPEALSVMLPYSKDSFSVPSNLHILGTMNTADRSLAMMDTALRRRFDFCEMMPDYSLLDSEAVGSINLGHLLRTMNERIEYLYDREHTLGHAFFMPVTELESEDERFQMLSSVFAKKVLPLLEEYFFEDWEKIRLVLGDNQKQDKKLHFVVRSETSPHALFGSQFDDQSVGESVRYKVNAAAFDNPEAYRLIAGKPAINTGTAIENE